MKKLLIFAMLVAGLGFVACNKQVPQIEAVNDTVVTVDSTADTVVVDSVVVDSID